MKKIRIVLSVLAIAFATLAAYSFTRHPAPLKSGTRDVQYWIKYDCRTSPAPLIVTSGVNYTTLTSPTGLPDYAGKCPGTASICAKLFHEADVEDDPNHPGNKRPISGRGDAQITLERCLSIAP